MFAGLLPENIKIYATTASNPTESSWACYWEATRKAYVGDTYSVNFLEDSDAADMSKETFQDQFVNIKAKTTESHVMQYGDMSIAPEPIGNFLTVPTAAKPRLSSRLILSYIPQSVAVMFILKSLRPESHVWIMYVAFLLSHIYVVVPLLPASIARVIISFLLPFPVHSEVP